MERECAGGCSNHLGGAMKITSSHAWGYFYVFNLNDSNMKMREREAGQSGELFGSKRPSRPKGEA